MKKTSFAAALLLAAAAAVAPAQADSFIVNLLSGAHWQPPKCKAPEVLTQVRDAKGNITFRCALPKAN
jgi:hypothetical protein